MSYDHDRRIANIVRVGVIHELNEVHPDGPRVTVDLGDVVTDWLPWLTLRAGEDRTWWAPEPGEQVLVLSPSGELAQGFVLAGVPCDTFPANGDRKTLQRVTYADGTVVEYDRAAHQLKVDASASNGAVLVEVGSGSVTVNCATATVNATSSVTFDTPTVHCTQNLQVDGALGVGGQSTLAGVTSNGKDVGSTHKHSGVQSGTGTSGTPV